MTGAAMNKALRIGMVAGVALGADIAPAYAQMPIYDNSPRIITVPQGRAYGAAPSAVIDDDYTVEPGLERIDRPKPRKPVKTFAPRIHPQAPSNEPRRATLTAPPEPKRSVLTAPPPPPSEGPTPIRPTPRWRNTDRADLPPVVDSAETAPR
jgi:hypothetical protein